jgi:dolichol kinase
MIGNLVFIMPYFTQNIYPFLVACPFILITFLVTPYSPFPKLYDKLRVLRDITEEGHNTGLVFYSLSFSVLTFFYGAKPYIISAGILPLAYGDSAAALIGMRFGRRKIGDKSLEGCVGMFFGSLITLLIGMFFFSSIYGFSFIDQLIPVMSVSGVVTLSELVSPSGFDNLTIPFLGVFTFLFMGGIV